MILSGPSGSGKSTSLNILARALNRLNALLFAPDHSKDELTTDRDFMFYAKNKLGVCIWQASDNAVLLMLQSQSWNYSVFICTLYTQVYYFFHLFLNDVKYKYHISALMCFVLCGTKLHLIYLSMQVNLQSTLGLQMLWHNSVLFFYHY